MPCIVDMPLNWRCCTDAGSYSTKATSVDVELKGGSGQGGPLNYKLYLEYRNSNGTWSTYASKSGIVERDAGILRFPLSNNAPSTSYRLRIFCYYEPGVPDFHGRNYYSPAFPVARSGTIIG